MKGGKYKKTLAKIQVKRIFSMRDIRRNVLPKVTEICMETLPTPNFGYVISMYKVCQWYGLTYQKHTYDILRTYVQLLC